MKIERIQTRGRAPFMLGASIVCASALLSGCMSSPTYGTDKTANQQLAEDLSGIFSIAPSNRGSEIAYTPRPELVRPASLEVLPEPQQNLASAENAAWPESPEERRTRLRDEATENQDNPFYQSPITGGATTTRTANTQSHRERNLAGRSPKPMVLEGSPQQRAEVQRRLRERNQGDPAVRRYLSEPPLDYRRPSETAAAGELGEDERVKERRLREAAGKSTSWRDFVPWL